MERSRKLILVADDEEDWRNRARTALTRNGYEVLLADSKDRALEVIYRQADQGHPFDLLVVDKSMGTGRWDEGLELFRALRELENEVPVIIYAFDIALSAVEELKGHAGWYVRKDWNPPQADLIKAVEHMLSE